MRPFSPFKFPLDGRPDHVQAVLVVFADSLKPGDRFLGQRNQKPLIPEFLASHGHKLNHI